ncbi:MAG TPA: right-handed parallel beta-helix repeat-containing protein, partial [Ignavibacteriales bacterium]|nr:right-handed parallel beta-helix repeat-containing protein [Ignavibacteriales bacterium]
MRNLFISMLLALSAFVLISSNKAMAANSDTLTVYSGGVQTLDEILTADVTGTGAQAHKVYKLVSLDTTYIYLDEMTISSDVEIIGVPGSNGRKPCIQPGILEDNSMPPIGFIFSGKGQKALVKNIYFFGTAIDGTWNWGKQLIITGDSVKLAVDNCVVEENRGEVIGYSGTWDKIYLTNTVIKNCVYHNDQWSTSVVTAVYPTSNPADTVVVKNCTIFNVNGPGANVGSSQVSKYLEFSHNTFVYNFSGPLGIGTVGHVKVNDNVFYGTWAGGVGAKEYSWYYSNPGSADTASIINLDTLNAALDSLWDPTNYGKPDARMLAEAKRIVEVKNNVFFCPKSLTDFYKNWNDTAAATNTLYVPSFMNKRTKKMFDNDAAWPGFVESGNIIGVDPGFNADVQAVVTEKGANAGVESLIDYIL